MLRDRLSQLSLRSYDDKWAGNFDDIFSKSRIAAKMLPKKRSRCCFPTSSVIIVVSRDAITLFINVCQNYSKVIHFLRKICIARLNYIYNNQRQNVRCVGK